MSLSKRHHYIQVVLKTIDHLWYHQVTGLVILHARKKECVSCKCFNIRVQEIYIQQEKKTNVKRD